MKQRLLEALQCSLGTKLYNDCTADEQREGQQGQTHTARDITDALVKKAKDGDTQAIALILQIAEFEPKG
jgi:hypothetical protein